MPKREERGFKYQSRSKDAVKERANMKGGNYDTIFKSNFKTWKPKEGKNIVRILPPTWKGAKHYGLDIFVNYSIGPDKQAYLSLSKHGKGDDPLAEARREAQSEGDKEYAKKLNPSQRILYWIIDRNDEEEGPQLWAAPFTFDKNLANMCIDEDTKDVIELDNPVEGRDVRFYREGTMLNTDYPAAKMKLMPSSSVHEDEGQEGEWLEFIQENSLPDVLNFYDYDHIKAQFDGQSKSDDDEDEKPARNSRSKKPADDDEEDEKPARRSRAKSDEDEDERPTRSRRGKTDDDDEDDEPKGGSRRESVREKLNAARSKRRNSDDD